MSTEDATPERTSPERERKRKRPRKVSARSLGNVALHYLERYAATVAQLRRVLVRRVDRSLRLHGGDRAQALGWVDAVVEKLSQGGFVNDAAYASMKAQSLRSGGRSARAILQKLRVKGVSAQLAQTTLAKATQELPEEEAARIWARKKRLGPFRRDLSTRAEHRQKDLAALARAGFSFGIAKRIIDAHDD